MLIYKCDLERDVIRDNIDFIFYFFNYNDFHSFMLLQLGSCWSFLLISWKAMIAKNAINCWCNSLSIYLIIIHYLVPITYIDQQSNFKKNIIMYCLVIQPS